MNLSSLIIVTTLFLNTNRIHSLSSSKQQRKVAVIGTTGRLARKAVERLASRGIPTRCLLRHSLKKEILLKNIDDDGASESVAMRLASLEGVEMVKGDVTDLSTLVHLMEGCTDVLALHGPSSNKPFLSLFVALVPGLDRLFENNPSHPRQVNYLGVKNILDAARAPGSKVRRIVRITGKGETPYSIFSILINALGWIAKGWNYEGEELLRSQDDFDYTIIRPGVMSTPEATEKGSVSEGVPELRQVKALADNGGDLKVTPVSHDQIAELSVECMYYPNAARATLTAMNVPAGTGEETYEPLLEQVVPDSRGFPTSLIKKHKSGARIGACVLSILLAVVVKSTLGLLLKGIQILF